jgi:phage terminase large subunit-like protein
VHDLVEEFSAFPNGANDDQVDGCSQAIAWLEENKPFAIRSSGIRVY